MYVSRPKRRQSLAAGASDAAMAAVEASAAAEEDGGRMLAAGAAAADSMLYELFSVMVHSGSAFGGESCRSVTGAMARNACSTRRGDFRDGLDVRQLMCSPRVHAS